MKKNIAVLVICISLLSCNYGCALFNSAINDIQASWNKLTPNERARIVVGGFQDQLKTLFDLGKSYVSSHPEKQTEWKTKVVPAFDTANKSARGYITMVGAGTATPDTVFKEMTPLVVSIANLLTAMGVNVGGAI